MIEAEYKSFNIEGEHLCQACTEYILPKTVSPHLALHGMTVMDRMPHEVCPKCDQTFLVFRK